MPYSPALPHFSGLWLLLEQKLYILKGMENKKNTFPHIKPLRLKHLPEDLRDELKLARKERGWSQQELGRQLGMTQRHISEIETGKIVPRYDTLIEIVRLLGHDLVLVPRELQARVFGLIRDFNSRDQPTPPGGYPLHGHDNHYRYSDELHEEIHE